MAITIKTTPDNISPVYNNIVFTVDSTNKANCGFQYVCDVYINSNYITTLKLYPQPGNGYASFKVNRTLEDFISSDLHLNLYGNNIFANNPKSIIDYVLKFGEEYDTSSSCDQGTTVFPNLTVTSTYRAFNGALQYDEWISWNSNNYSLGSTASLFLTTAPDKLMINYGDQFTLNFINTGVISSLEVKTYNDNNTLLGTYQYNNGFNAISSVANRILTVGVGPENLNNSLLALGTQSVITPSVSYYTVQIVDIYNSPLTQLKRFNLDNRPKRFSRNRIWWLNRLGAYDSYSFDLMDTRKININRTEFNKLIGNYRTNNTWTYDLGDRGRTVLNVNANEANTYNCDWLTEKESLWMETLFTTGQGFMSTTNNKMCLTGAFIVGEDQNDIMVNSPNHGFNVGDTVQLFIEGYTPASFTITSVTPDTFLVTNIYTLPPDPYPPLHVSYIKNNFISQLDPIILKSGTFDEKIKYRVKNIQYTIEVEKAYAINIQRN